MMLLLRARTRLLIFLSVVSAAFTIPAAAQPGNAIQFTKTSSQYGATPSGTVFNTAQFSTEFWVKLPENSTWDFILDHGYTVVSGSHGWYIANGSYTGAANAFIVAGIRNSGTQKEIYLPINTTDWTHVAFTFDGTTLRGYKNGVFSLSVTLDGGATYNPTLSRPFFLGTYGLWNGTAWNPGGYNDDRIDEVRIFNTVLSDQTIARRYMAPMSAEHPNNANLIAHWKFDEASGTSASEIGGIERTFSYVNAPARAVSGARIFATGVSSITPLSGTEQTVLTASTWGGVTSNVFFGNIKGPNPTHLGNGVLQLTVPASAGFGPITLVGGDKTARLSIPFVKSLPGTPATLNASLFQAQSVITDGYPYEIGTADFDGDGKPDFLKKISSNNATVYIYRNASTGSNFTFDAAVNVSMGGEGMSNISTGDVNADGKLDLLVGEFVSGTGYVMSVYPNTTSSGTISFGSRITSNTSTITARTEAADIDGDGRLDVVQTSTSSPRLIFHRNTTTGGTISFSTTTVTLSDTSPYGLQLVDLTGDGLPEVITTDYNYTGAENGGSFLRIFINRSSPGTISFSENDKADFSGLNEPISVRAADLDGDGKLDFIVPQNGSSSVRWYRNTSTGATLSFTSNTAAVPYYNARSLTLEDFNGDGKPDVLLNWDSQLTFLENQSTPGTISFAGAQSINAYQDGSRAPVAADFNNDGKLDIVASGVSGNWGHVFYKNLSIVPGFELSATTVAKGTVNFGTTRDSVLITNPGSAALTVSNVVSSHSSLIPDFTSATIAAGASRYLAFTQVYESAGAQSNTLTITHNGPASPATVTVTYTGSPAAAANAGNRVVLDGTNDYLTRTGVFTTATDNVTLEGWFFATSVTGGNRILMYNGSTGSSGYGLFLNASGEIRALLGGVSALNSGTTLPVNEWMHLVLTRESGTWKLYVDGELRTLSANTTAPITPSGSISIGANQSGSERFAGSIDEVRMWTTARTQTQIRQSYASRTGNESGLAAYYRFDHASGVLATDFSGNGRHLSVLNGGTFAVSTAPVGTPGTIAAAISPYNVAFGNRIIGQPATIDVTLGNTGSGILHYGIDGATSAPFSKSATDIGVKAGAAKTVTYTYIPTEATTSSTGLSYTSQSGTGTFPTISGTGVLTAPTSAGNALSFDGTDDFVEILDATDPTAYTIEAWVRFNAITPGTAQNVITRTSASGPNTHHTHTIFLTTTGTFGHYAFFDQNASGTVTGTTTVQPNRWYHVAITAQNSGMMRLFVNGVEEGTALAVQTLWTAGDRWSVGANSANNSRVWFNGQLDELRIWSAARTAAEIQASYAPVAGNATNLSRIWRFDETSGSAAYNGTANNVQGTVNGAARVTSTAPVAAPSVTLSAFAFGNVEAGSSTQLVRYLKNPTGGVANVTLSENGTYYSMSPASATVPRGDSVAVTVTFSPVATGAQNATLSIAGNATGSAAISGTGVVSVNGTAGNALVLNGSRSGTIPRMISDDFTIEFFVKTTQSAGASTGNWYSGQGIVDAEVAGIHNDFGVSMGNGKLLFGIGNPDVTVRSKYKINDGLWHHVAATRNRTTGRIVLFIDGMPHDSATANTASLTTPSNIAVGQLQTGINPFVGTLDELRIWNVARTGTQIRSTINATVAGTASGLVGYLRFDAASGNTFQNLVNASSVLTMNSVALETPTTAPLPGGYPLLSAASLGFGTREVGSSTQLQAVLTNYGSSAITISSITSTNPAFSGSASVSSVAVNGTSTITVQYTPAAVTSYTDTIRIFHSGIGSVLVLPVSGSGASAVIDMAASKAFGIKKAGATYADSVLISNTGGWAMNITGATVSGSGYTLPATTASISAGGSTYFKVNFAPTQAQSYPAWLILTHNGPTSPDSVQLSGTGAVPSISFASSSISFGAVANGQSKSDSVEVTSSGDVTLVISGVASTNARFASSSTGTVASGASKWIKVTFSPTASGTQNGFIVLTHDGPTSPDTITVSGAGVPGAALTAGNGSWNGSLGYGQGNYWKRDYVADLNPSSNFTYEIWALPDYPSVGNYQTVLSSRKTFHGITIYKKDTGEWMLLFGDGLEWKSIIGPKAAAQVWTHLAATYSGGVMRFYVNGTLAGSLESTYVPNDELEFRIGQISDALAYVFPGMFDEARVWNVARSAAQIKASMTGSMAANTAGLVAYWRFDEANGAKTANDLTGNGHHLSGIGYTQVLSSYAAPLFKGEAIIPDRFEFGLRELNETHSLKFWLRNYGGGNYVLTNVTSNLADFAVAPASATIAAGDSLEISVNFTPSGYTNQTAQLNFTKNSASYANFYPTATGRGQTQVFAQQGGSLSSLSNPRLLTPDLDGDGLQDIFVLGWNSGASQFGYQFLRNTGDFGFEPVALTGVTVQQYEVEFADMNNDGLLDIVNNTGWNMLNIYLNNGDNTFTSAGFSPGFSMGSAILGLGDYDNDGRTDIYISGWTGTAAATALFRNTGSGYVNTGNTFTALNNGARWVDFNGDGWKDLITWGDAQGGWMTQQLYFYKNNGDGTFTSHTHGIVPVHIGWIDFTDINNDGRLDVLLSGRRNDWSSRLDVWTAAEDFTYAISAQMPGFQASKSVFADVNNDGFVDVVAAGSAQSSSYALTIFLNNGSGGFGEAQNLSGLNGAQLAVADLNNDGKVDLVNGGYNASSQHKVHVFRNNTAVTNTAPGAPSNLTAEFDGEHMILRWDAATDAQGGPLRYNVKVGTESGSFNRIRSYSHVTGAISIAAFPNAGNKRMFIIPNVSLNEPIFWTVQAVDAGHRAGAFATEQSVGNFAQATIGGNTEGWRFVTSPAPGTTFAELLNGIWTQGATGAKTTSGAPNVYQFNEPTGQWQAVTNLNNAMEMGRGYAVYVFARNVFNDVESAVWPKVLTSARKPSLADRTLNLSYTSGPASAGFNLVGNPFPFPIDMEAETGLTRTGVGATHYIYRAETGSYATYINGVTGLNGASRYVAPYQGFWVAATGNGSVFGLARAARHTGAPAGFLKQAAEAGIVRLALTNGKRSDETAIRIAQSPLGVEVVQMEALTADFAFVFSHGAGGKKLDLFEVNSASSRNEIPLKIQASPTDSLTLTWPELKNLPESWDAVLLIDGKRIDLKKSTAWTWKSAGLSKAAAGADSLLPGGPAHLTASQLLEFNATLLLGEGVLTSLDRDAAIPSAFEVLPNHPNPFNPTTTFRFGLPQAGQVSVDVFDLTGRTVATVARGLMAAGWHSVTFDARSLASGTYLVRYSSGTGIVTRKITLLK